MAIMQNHAHACRIQRAAVSGAAASLRTTFFLKPKNNNTIINKRYLMDPYIFQRLGYRWTGGPEESFT